jgi:pimeloyl-ACP methyl ester carboxylesterase
VWPVLAEEHRVVRWHYRGHGRSDPPANPEEVIIASVVRDLEAVVDAAGIERAVLVGHSYGVQVVCEAYRARPELAAGLVAVAGAFGHPMGTVLGRDPGVLLFPLLELATWPAPRVLTEVLRAGLRSPFAYWIGRAIGGIGADAPRETMDRYFEHVAGLDLDLLLRMFRAMQAHSSEDILPKITVPTVVLSGTRDGMTPPRRARRMAEAIPGAQLRELPTATHVLPIEEPAAVVDAVRRVVQAAEASA